MTTKIKFKKQICKRALKEMDFQIWPQNSNSKIYLKAQDNHIKFNRFSNIKLMFQINQTKNNICSSYTQKGTLHYQ